MLLLSPLVYCFAPVALTTVHLHLDTVDYTPIQTMSSAKLSWPQGGQILPGCFWFLAPAAAIKLGVGAPFGLEPLMWSIV